MCHLNANSFLRDPLLRTGSLPDAAHGLVDDLHRPGAALGAPFDEASLATQADVHGERLTSEQILGNVRKTSAQRLDVAPRGSHVAVALSHADGTSQRWLLADDAGKGVMNIAKKLARFV